LTSLVFWLWICGQLKQRSCPHTHSHYYDFDPVNTNFHRKDKLHFKNGTFCVLTDGSTLSRRLPRFFMLYSTSDGN